MLALHGEMQGGLLVNILDVQAGTSLRSENTGKGVTVRTAVTSGGAIGLCIQTQTA